MEEPQTTRIKLNARPKAVLHLGAKSSQSSIDNSGFTVDKDALNRQKQMVQAGVNGQQTPQSAIATPQAVLESREVSTPPVVKTEKAAASPAPDVARIASAGPDVKASASPVSSMQPPNADATRIASVVPEVISSPNPSMLPPARMPSGSPHPAAQPVVQTTYSAPMVPAPATFVETFSRTKPVSESLLPNINISSHPRLGLAKPLSLDIPASAEFTQQSITLSLDPAQCYLQISPQVSQALSSGRQYKLFVSVNTFRASPAIRPQVNGDVINSLDKKPVYDIPVNQGVNRIEIEIVALTGRGGQLEVEKTVVLANLLKY